MWKCYILFLMSTYASIAREVERDKYTKYTISHKFIECVIYKKVVLEQIRRSEFVGIRISNTFEMFTYSCWNVYICLQKYICNYWESIVSHLKADFIYIWPLNTACTKYSHQVLSRYLLTRRLRIRGLISFVSDSTLYYNKDKMWNTLTLLSKYIYKSTKGKVINIF